MTQLKTQISPNENNAAVPPAIPPVNNQPKLNNNNLVLPQEQQLLKSRKKQLQESIQELERHNGWWIPEWTSFKKALRKDVEVNSLLLKAEEAKIAQDPSHKLHLDRAQAALKGSSELYQQAGNFAVNMRKEIITGAVILTATIAATVFAPIVFTALTGVATGGAVFGSSSLALRVFYLLGVTATGTAIGTGIAGILGGLITSYDHYYVQKKNLSAALYDTAEETTELIKLGAYSGAASGLTAVVLPAKIGLRAIKAMSYGGTRAAFESTANNTLNTMERWYIAENQINELKNNKNISKDELKKQTEEIYQDLNLSRTQLAKGFVTNLFFSAFGGAVGARFNFFRDGADKLRLVFVEAADTATNVVSGFARAWVETPKEQLTAETLFVSAARDSFSSVTSSFLGRLGTPRQKKDPQIKRRPIHNDDPTRELDVSELSMGMAPLGGLFTDVDQTQAHQTIHAALGRGVNYIDAALFYGGGKALQFLGVGIGEHPAKDLRISFKVGRVLVNDTEATELAATGTKIQDIDGYVCGDYSKYYYDYSAKGVKRAFDQSMEQLNVERTKLGWKKLTPEDLNIIVLVHDPEVASRVPGTNPDNILNQLLKEAYPTLKRLQDDKQIIGYGLGTNEFDICLKSLTDPFISFFLPAGRFTLLCNGADQAPYQIWCDSNQAELFLNKLRQHPNQPKIIAAAIGNSGLGYGADIYNYAPASKEVIVFRNKIFVALNEYNTKHKTNISIHQLLVQYPLVFGGKDVVTVMPGPRSAEEFNQCYSAYQNEVPMGLWKFLQFEGLINRNLKIRRISNWTDSIKEVVSNAFNGISKKDLKIKRSSLSVSPEVEIPEVTLGTAPLAGLYAGVGEHDACVTVGQALRRGLNYQDTALLYGGGRALELLGIGIGEHPPKDLVISIKVGRVLIRESEVELVSKQGKQVHKIENFEGANYPYYYYDYSSNGIELAFQQSMALLSSLRQKRGWAILKPEDLKLLVLVHDPGVAEHGANQPRVMNQVLTDSYPYLKMLQTLGQIKAYGLGTNEIGPCLASLVDSSISFFLPAGRFTLFCNGARKAPAEIQNDSRNIELFLKKLREHPNRPKIFAAAPANSGLGHGADIYNYAPASREVIAFRNAIFAALTEYNQRNKTNVSIHQLMMQYALVFGGEEVATVIPGPRSEGELDDSCHAYMDEVPIGLWKYLQSKGLINSNLKIHKRRQ